MVRLESWLEIGGRLFGNVYGHPNKTLHDGSFVRTSPIKYIDTKPRADGTMQCQTENTTYLLGNKAGIV